MADPQTDFGTTIPARIAKDPERSKTIGAIFLFKIEGEGGGTWTVNLKDDPGVKEGDAGNSDCQLQMTVENWRKINESPQAAMQLYFSGELKVTGNVILATKLQQILGG